MLSILVAEEEVAIAMGYGAKPGLVSIVNGLGEQSRKSQASWK